MNDVITPQQALELGLNSKTAMLDLVRALDIDLIMLAKDEYANTDGFTVKAQRATANLMSLVALIAPELIATEEEAQ